MLTVDPIEVQLGINLVEAGHKVAVLAVLWWVFVRDHQVPVDAERAADRFGVTTSAQGGHP